MQDNISQLQPTATENLEDATALIETATENIDQTTNFEDNKPIEEAPATENVEENANLLVTEPIEDVKKTEIVEKATQKIKHQPKKQATPNKPQPTNQPLAITLKFFGESGKHLEAVINEGIQHGCWANKTQFAEQCIDFAINHNLATTKLEKGCKLSFPYPDGLNGSELVPNKLLKNSRYKGFLDIPQF